MNLKPLIASCLLATVMTSAIKAENLLEIYRLAVDNDPIFLSAGAQLEANLEGSNQSLASLLPNINASYGVDYGKSSREAGPGTAAYFESSGSTAAISLTQSIYDYSTWVNYDQAKKRVEQAKIIFRSQQQDLIVRVAQVYLDVLSAQDNLEFAMASQEAIKQQLEQTKQRYEVGLIAITDVHEAQADYDQSEATRIQSKNRLDNAIEALREVTGRYHESLGTFKKDIPLTSPEPAKIDDWVQVARESNLNVISSNMDLYIARQEIKRRFGGHLPSVNLNARYSDSESDPANVAISNIPVDTETYGVSAGVTFNIPIYSGGRTHSTVVQSQALSKKAEFDLESAMRSTIRSARSAYLNVEASIASIKALEQSVVSQESALEATQAGFEVGTRTIVDVLQSTRSLFQAKSALADARYNYILAILQLKQSAGILSSDDVMLVNQWIENQSQTRS